MTAYRHVLVPAEKKTCAASTWASRRQGDDTQPAGARQAEGRAADARQARPGFLVLDLRQAFRAWPEDQEMINVRTLADYFTQLTHLPRLLGPRCSPTVLPKACSGACSPMPWATARRRSSTRSTSTTRRSTADRCEITESAWLLRPDLAKSLMPETEPVVASARLTEAAPPRCDWRSGEPGSR